MGLRLSVGVAYSTYYAVLIGTWIAQSQYPRGVYSNWGAASVCGAHFAFGFAEAVILHETLWKATKFRYIDKLYNVVADILLIAALAISIYCLVVLGYRQVPWSANTAVALALVGNLGCTYGRIVDEPYDVNDDNTKRSPALMHNILG